MPFITCKVSCPLSWEQEVEIKERMGKAIELVPGKSEEYLLLSLEGDSHLWLRGEKDKPIGYIEAAIFGNEGHVGHAAFSAAVADIFHEVLGIPLENLYIRYEDICAWSVGGQYIDRRMYW
ncbi:MAG: hypothetical protein IIZ39_13795 [Blautia sp.]|nr:hypothetical protein [Blautia sp.]